MPNFRNMRSVPLSRLIMSASFAFFEVAVELEDKENFSEEPYPRCPYSRHHWK